MLPIPHLLPAPTRLLLASPSPIRSAKKFTKVTLIPPASFLLSKQYFPLSSLPLNEVGSTLCAVERACPVCTRAAHRPGVFREAQVSVVEGACPKRGRRAAAAVSPLQRCTSFGEGAHRAGGVDCPRHSFLLSFSKNETCPRMPVLTVFVSFFLYGAPRRSKGETLPNPQFSIKNPKSKIQNP